jgi:hypothetical protein
MLMLRTTGGERTTTRGASQLPIIWRAVVLSWALLLLATGCEGTGAENSSSSSSSAPRPIETSTTKANLMTIEYLVEPSNDDPRAWFSDYEILAVAEGGAYLGDIEEQLMVVFACGDSIVRVGPGLNEMSAPDIADRVSEIAEVEGCFPPSLPAPTECLGLDDDPAACGE